MKRRSLVLLAALCAGLFAWDQVQLRENARRRDSSGVVGHLLTQDERARTGKVAGITLERGSGVTFQYVRESGVWRCVTYHRATASTALIESMWKKILEAEGVVQTRDAAVAADFGLATDRAWRITFHGTAMLQKGNQDVLHVVEFGDASGTHGCFARRPPDPAVWRVDVNPRLELERDTRPGLPPMLEWQVIPTNWPGGNRQVQSVRLERGGALEWELRGHAVPRTPEEFRSGLPAWDWVLRDAGGERVVPRTRGSSYVSFLLRLPFESIEDRGPPRSAADPTVLTIVPVAGRALTLTLNRGTDPGSPRLHCSASGLNTRIEARLAAWLAPTSRTLLDADGDPPWLGLLPMNRP